MLNALDENVQWLALLLVYGQETWVLPLAAVVILGIRGRPWMIPVRVALLLLLLIYVVVFRMHWHSWLAVPVLVLVIVSDAVHTFWYRWLGGSDLVRNFLHRLPRGLRPAPAHGSVEPTTGRPKRLQWYGWYRIGVWGVQIVAGVAAFVYFDAPTDLWAIAVAAAGLAAVWGLIPRWRVWAERRFQSELTRDPRLGRYLDWVRRTRERRLGDGQSILAENWIAGKRTHAEPRGVSLWLARRLVRQRRMATIESASVCQNLREGREGAWQAFQRHLHGCDADTKLLAPVSQILESVSGKGLLLDWLAMTEALAECEAFVDEPAGKPLDIRPRWLMASELLAHAGEVEQEIVLDLKREPRTRSEAVKASPEGVSRLDEQHLARAVRYFDLAACCVENYLEPGSGVPGAPLGARWQRVVNNRPDWWRHRPEPNAKAEEDALWRRVLALRYQLLGTLSPQYAKGVPKAPHVTSLFRADVEYERQDELLAAALARDAAESSLWIATNQGDPSSRWVFDDRRLWADRLKQADYWQARLLRSKGDDNVALAEMMIRRVLHLWGLAIEQDLDVLRPGTDIWRDRLETAADFFIYEGSLRVKRLAGLAQRTQTSPIFDKVVELV